MEKQMNTAAPVRALIVDDEFGAREIMFHLLQRIHDVEVVGKANSVDEAIELTLNTRPDIIFLDVQMPEKNGFELISYFHRLFISVHIVFVTAHAQYAIDAFKVSAFDYLLKPVMFEELQQTILRYKAARNSGQNEYQKIVEHPAVSKLKFNTRTGYLLVSPGEIMYCLADTNYTQLFFGKEKKETITMNLGKVEEMLSTYSFVRISRSILVNQLYLSKADRKHRKCFLTKENETVVLEISQQHIRVLEKHIDALSENHPGIKN